MSLESPAAMRTASTHPTTPVRYLQMRKVIAEIAEKKAKNLPLLPELKKKPEEPRLTAGHGDIN